MHRGGHQTIAIRPAVPGDAGELARLRWDFSPEEVQASGQSFADFAQGFEYFLKEALSLGRWRIWVAERDGSLIANTYVQVVAKVPRPGRFDSRYGYITNVYTEPAARGSGIGTRLLRQVIAWSREQGLQFLIVWPSDASIGFYERCGFVRSAEALELHLLEEG